MKKINIQLKRALSVFLAVIMLIGSVPLSGALCADLSALALFASAEGEATVVSIEIPTIELVENIDGNWCTEYNSNDEPVRYFKYDTNFDSCEYITVTMSDGTKYKGEPWEVQWDLQWDFDIYIEARDNQSPDNQWTVGNYTAVAFVGDFEVEYDIVIVENPVASFTVDTIDLIENLNGYYEEGSYEDDETGKEIDYEYFRYSLNYEDIHFTVRLSDGEILEGDVYDMWDYFDEEPIIIDGQDFSNPWGLGEHTVYVSLMGVESSFTVNVKEFPIDRIEIPTVSVAENNNGSWESWCWDEEIGDYVEVDTYFHYDVYPRNFTVYYKDQDREPEFFEDAWDFDYAYGFPFEYYDDQSYKNPWGAGMHKAYYKVADLVTEYQFEVTAHPIESISVTDAELIEYVDGYMNNDTYYDEETDEEIPYSYFHYCVDWEKLQLTVTTSDGEVIQGNAYYIDEVFDYDLSIDFNNQDHNTPWDLGTHTGTITLMGKSFDFEIDVVENPIERIEVEPVVLSEISDAEFVTEYWDEELEEWVGIDGYYYYGFEPEAFTVYYKDENRLPETYEDLWSFWDATGYTLESYDDQSHENPWGYGTHTAYLKLGKFVAEYDVVINSHPIESVSAINAELIEYIDGYMQEETYYDDEADEEITHEYFYYSVNWDKLQLMVTLSNGEVIQGNADYISKVFDYDMSIYLYGQDYNNQWGLGAHTGTIELKGRKFEFEINVVESPIDRIEVEPLLFTELTNGEWVEEEWNEELDEWIEVNYFKYYVSPQSFTVYYKDENREPETYDDLWDFSEETGFSVERYDDQSHENPWGVGTHTAYLKVGKFVAEYEVEITSHPIESIEVAPVVLTELTNGWVSEGSYYDEETDTEIPYSYFYYSFDLSDMNITVTMSNGDVIEGFGDSIVGYFDYDYHIEINQSHENPWGLGDHTGTMTLMGKEVEFTVTIVELPIDRIEVEPLLFTEMTNGEWVEEEWNEELDEWIEVNYFKYYVSPQSFTIYYKDENREPENYEDISEFYEATGYNYEYYDDQSHENPWGVGTHTAYLRVGKLVTEYDVEITAHPIESIEVAPVELIEYVNGEMDEGTYYDEETDEDVPYSYFRYYLNWEKVYLTVTTTDGEIIEGNANEISEAFDYELSIHTDQGYDAPWQLGENTATVDLLGKAVEFTVNVVENPIERIEVEPIVITENTGGWLVTEYWDEELDDYVETNYYKYEVYPQELTVYYKDENREPEKYEDISAFYEATGYNYEYYDDQSHENPWGVGTYTAYLKIGNLVTEYDVEITAHPIESIEVAPVELIEYVNGEMDEGTYYDEETDEDVPYSYFRYYLNWEKVYLTVTMTDGDIMEGSADEINEAFDYELSIYTDQGYDAPWQLGENTATVELLGKSFDFTVTVVENSIERIEVEPIVITELYDSWFVTEVWDDELGDFVEIDGYHHYEYSVNEFTVYYKDENRAPETYEGWWDFYEETGFDFETYDDQSHKNPWDVGTHTAYMKIGKVVAEFDIEVLAHPIAKIEVEPVELVENFHGSTVDGYYFDGDEDVGYSYFRYEVDYSSIKLKVTMSDGEVVEGNGYYIYDYFDCDFDIRTDQNYNNTWSLGKHTATVYIMGREAEFEINIVESPIASVEIPTLYLWAGKGGWIDGGWYEDENGEEVYKSYYHYSLSNCEFDMKVTLKDGTVFVGDFYDFWQVFGYYPDFETDQSISNPWLSGTHTATTNILGKVVKVNVEFCTHGNAVDYARLAPTCEYDGYTAGTYCLDCKYWIDGREPIDMVGHEDENTDDICDKCGNNIYFEYYSDIFAKFNLMSTQFDEDENVPDETLFYYLVWSKCFEEYFDTDEWAYIVPYSEYMAIADKHFANHSDMVGYFENCDMFTDDTKQTVKWYDGGFGDASAFMLTNVHDLGNGKLVLQGVRLYLGYNEDDIDDSYNYYTKTYEYRDMFGNVTTYEDYAEVGTGFNLTVQNNADTVQIISLLAHNFYILDGSLYEIVEDDLRIKYDRFDINCGEGATVVTTEGADGYVEHNDSTWFNAGGTFGFDIELEYGYELVSVTLEDNNGVRALNEFSFGGYSVHPDGKATLTVETKKTQTHIHDYEEVTTRATLTKNGKIQKVCKCGDIASSKTIYRPDTIELSNESYTYNGEAKKPKIYVEDTKGKELKVDTDYTVTYEKGRKNPGRYTVTVKFKGKYSGTQDLEFTIKPRKVYDLEAEQTTTTITLSWSESVGADGYRVYKYNSDTDEYEKLADVTETTYKLSGLKSATKCEFKVRAFVKADGTIYGNYSDALETATKPKSTSITSVKSSSKGKAKVVWDDVSRESKYQLYYATSKNGTYKRCANYDANETSATVSGLTSGKTYYFKVRSYKNTDSGKVYSSYSAVKSVKVK